MHQRFPYLTENSSYGATRRSDKKSSQTRKAPVQRERHPPTNAETLSTLYPLNKPKTTLRDE
jgi:hypothetical protein